MGWGQKFSLGAVLVDKDRPAATCPGEETTAARRRQNHKSVRTKPPSPQMCLAATRAAGVKISATDVVMNAILMMDDGARGTVIS